MILLSTLNIFSLFSFISFCGTTALAAVLFMEFIEFACTAIQNGGPSLVALTVFVLCASGGLAALGTVGSYPWNPFALVFSAIFIASFFLLAAILLSGAIC